MINNSSSRSQDQAPATGRKRTGRLVLVLAALTAVAPLAVDMYVPGFPGLAGTFGAAASSVQLSLTAFLVGLAAGQLLLGPVSDMVGRRRVLLSGAALFTVLSLTCAVSPGIEIFDAARLVQGVAGAAGMVVARAVLTDRFHGTPEAGRHFATLSAIVFTAPVAAPVLGGAILGVGSWRLVFVALAGFGVLLIAGILAWVPESLPAARRRPGGVTGVVKAVAMLAGRRALVGYVLASSFTGAALFTYIAGSTFVFQDGYGLSATRYSLVFATNALGMLASSLVFGRLSARVPVRTLLVAGLAVAGSGTAALVGSLVMTGGSFATTWACLLVTVAGLGTALPATTTTVQSLGHDAPGAVSGLLGGSQFVLGAAASPLSGLLGDGALPMAAVMLAAFGLAALSLVLVRGAGGPSPS
ncbi:multidrug effflux MFS transporter [Nonomuraea roseoviolacea subsp. roseoviolacea]|uniref:DHA1 family bicyclomycin/chloramphenicol resistance-like MFS transporter n=1 Tax=Nonomuraea roseoviolacea subsp. carminata TaxID=160689 RepID=A0ABT1JSU2_9ACTN|nr:multidrug effflux MFS transporter [Nonomuraea roseoviolacea]MCP2344665.1 DHA1 family bicyclomycin/chloramphenicol resistance-like MFS transporter [Nonomuraea roseoviolacea subsp. carminata]